MCENKEVLNLVYSNNLDVIEYLDLFLEIYNKSPNKEELRYLVLNNFLFNFNEDDFIDLSEVTNKKSSDVLKKLPEFIFDFDDEHLESIIFKFNSIYFTSYSHYVPSNNCFPFQYLLDSKYSSDFKSISKILDYIFQAQDSLLSYRSSINNQNFLKDNYGRHNILTHLLYIKTLAPSNRLFNPKEKSLIVLLFLLYTNKKEYKSLKKEILLNMPIEIFDYLNQSLKDIKSNNKLFNSIMRKINKNIIKYKSKTKNNKLEFYKNCFKLNIYFQRI